MKLERPLLPFLALFALASVSFAQLDRTGLSGVITGASGGVVPGAKVTALQTETRASLTAMSDKAGAYNFIGLAVGTYDITAEKQGFRTAVRSGIVLTLKVNVRVDFTLEAGARTQQVSVAAAPAPLPEARNSSYTTSQGHQSSEQLPVQVSGGIRSMYSYLQTVPGVTNAGFSNNIMGGVGLYNGIVIDGVSAEYNPAVQGVAAATPDVEIVSEFKVVNSVNADYGPSGGAYMNYVTKSGTNNFHGDLYEINRNNFFDSRGFFSPSVNIDKENEFGTTAGGPLVIPHVYDGKDKSWVFGNYTHYLYHSAGSGALYTVPTALMRTGNFQELLGAPGDPSTWSQIGRDTSGNPVYAGEVYNPTTNAPDGVGGTTRSPYDCGGGIANLNIMCPGDISHVSSGFNAAWPAATLPGIVNNALLPTGLNTNDQWYMFVKEDQEIKQGRLTSSMRYFKGTGSTFSVLPGILDSTRGPLNQPNGVNFRVAYNRSLGRNWVTDTTIGMDRIGGGFVSRPDRAVADTTVGLIGTFIKCTPETYISGGFPSFSFHSCDQAEKDTNNKINEIISAFRGKHHIEFGASYIHWNANFPTDVRANGLMEFNATETALPDAFSSSTGYGYSSFMAGAVDSSQLQAPYEKALRSWYTGFFIQDEFRAASKLTLSYGLRYEIQPQYRSPHNDGSEFESTIPNAATGLMGALAFLSPSHVRFSDTYYKGFSGKLGFAYALTSRTMLRGSWGWFEAPVSQFSGELANRQGFDPSFKIASPDNGVTPAFLWDQGFPIAQFDSNPSEDPTVANNSASAFIGKSNAHPAQVQIISAGVQRQLPGNVLFDVAYVGNMSHHISSGGIEQINQLDYSKYASLGNLLGQDVSSPAAVAAGIKIPYAGFQGSVAQALRPYPQYLGINGITSMIGNSTYSGLYVKFQKRFSNGLSFLVGYTVSKNLSDVDTTPGFFAIGVQDAYNRRAEKSVSSNDFPQAVVASYTYELPFGHGKRFLKSNSVFSRYVLGGWSVSGIQTYHSGDPLGIGTNLRLPTTGDSLAQNQPGLRADVVPGVAARTGISCGGSFNPATDRLLNPAAFADPAPWSFGNSARLYGNIRGCSYTNENLSLLKTIPITDKANLRYSIDFFNAFNRKLFGDPGTNIDNPSSYGVVSSAGPGRVIQMSLKLLW